MTLLVATGDEFLDELIKEQRAGDPLAMKPLFYGGFSRAYMATVPWDRITPGSALLAKVAFGADQASYPEIIESNSTGLTHLEAPDMSNDPELEAAFEELAQQLGLAVWPGGVVSFLGDKEAQQVRVGPHNTEGPRPHGRASSAEEKASGSELGLSKKGGCGVKSGGSSTTALARCVGMTGRWATLSAQPRSATRVSPRQRPG